MKKSIFIAAFILLLVVGWIGSGQITNVNAQDDTIVNSQSTVGTTETVVVEDNGNKVEIKERPIIRKNFLLICCLKFCPALHFYSCLVTARFLLCSDRLQIFVV